VTTRLPNPVGDAAGPPGSDVTRPPPRVAELPVFDAGWVAETGDSGAALEARVAQRILRAHGSRIGNALWRLEDVLVTRGVRLRFGIRSPVVTEREFRGGE
jgi:hypothetical protein